ncbi:DNA-binding response OmpR family regulator [Rhizobium sp. BK196]|jgi:DNA-binding response OmpR family regulator|uniref:Response regulator n=1 Tax=Rhizobium mesosinicum TaxID=335017 RepID=A0ABS7GYK1_9HYPH|nr:MULTISPECIES: response regulator [Rhizobium]MBB3308654.1 DNA-binding response OmpR family regulator [Rhizobium sp. BK196]MBB3461492.1 DNA-binding response OmpR family regulator [Rhizobium sp. BK377]MBW9054902.1 response regulator [Rhizobium mesosinicum]
MISILCIDDETELRQILVEELEDAGFKTLQASNGQEGLEMIVSHWPDLVICDISMPVMSGHELLAELQVNYPELARTPFIMLTALADRDNMLSGLQAGAEAYFTKPIDFDLLMAKVSGCVTRIENERRVGHGL